MLDALPPQLADLPASRPEETGLSRPGLKRLIAAMEREIATGKAPGVTMMIARHGKVGFACALGDLKPGGPPMPLDAIFRIYSMTKPVVSVAAMMLVEEGRLTLADPIEKYVPAFADAKVGVERDGGLDLVALKRPITVQDLMRHTSGLTYGFTGASAVQKRLFEADLFLRPQTCAECVETLAQLALMHQPGEAWEYGHSTDVLGRIIEVIEGASLGEALSERIFAPLGMRDTAFFTPPAKLERRAEAHSVEALRRGGNNLIEFTEPPKFEIGGSGLLSTLGDYARFLAMLSGGGALDGVRILGPRTIAFMASDQLAPEVRKEHPLLWPGHGFGLGFAVRTSAGLAPTAGAIGEFFWGGIAGTSFWVSPRDSAFAIVMVQAPEYREYFRLLYRNLVNAAIL
jgi:CubicO group peptidase (beta-lactamase class C family)